MQHSVTSSLWQDKRLTIRRTGRNLPTINLLDTIVFLVPLLRFQEFDIFGRLFLTDVILAALLPFLIISRGRRLSAPLPRTMIILLLSWLLAQVLTDWVRSTPFLDYLRGWAMIGFTLINFCSIFLLLAGSRKRLVLFAAGAAFGGITGYFISPGLYAFGDPWKFGYGNGVSWLLTLTTIIFVTKSRFSHFLPAAILMFISVLNIYMGFRSAGGLAFLAGCYLVAQTLRHSHTTAGIIRIRQLVFIGAILASGAWGILQIYEHAAEAGWLGESARYKYDMQAAGEYGMLLGGRSEILVSSKAVLDSPVIGHGSWAKDCSYASLFLELKRRSGYNPGEEQEECLIPAHSHLMGAWVQTGVVGAVFWLWVLTLPVRTLARLFSTAERLTPLVAFVAFLLIWDIFFSPYGSERRFMTPYYIVLMMSFLPGVRR